MSISIAYLRRYTLLLATRSSDYTVPNAFHLQGLTFEKPEKVPFRITHNMVDAFGVTGVDGAFRKRCEVTLRVMRAHNESLRCVLEAFVHDPFVEWSTKKKV